MEVPSDDQTCCLGMFALLLGVQVWDIVERLPRLEWPLDYYFLLVLQMVTNDTAREGPACFKHD